LPALVLEPPKFFTFRLAVVLPVKKFFHTPKRNKLFFFNSVPLGPRAGMLLSCKIFHLVLVAPNLFPPLTSPFTKLGVTPKAAQNTLTESYPQAAFNDFVFPLSFSVLLLVIRQWGSPWELKRSLTRCLFCQRFFFSLLTYFSFPLSISRLEGKHVVSFAN